MFNPQIPLNHYRKRNLFFSLRASPRLGTFVLVVIFDEKCENVIFIRIEMIVAGEIILCTKFIPISVPFCFGSPSPIISLNPQKCADERT